MVYLPSQNFIQQYQAFLKAPDLFAHQLPSEFLPFVTDVSTPLQSTTLETWKRIISPNLVLGKRVEYFLHYYLQQQTHLQVLAHNLQIIQEKRTIGELDFLYYNKAEKQAYHLEQVYKFYIYYPTQGTDLEQWIGPNNKDSLIQKLNKLQHKQFPLLQHPATQQVLQQQGISTSNILPQLCFKAALFMPWQEDFPATSPLNPACWKGYWLTWEQFLEQKWENTTFHVLNKKNWGISPHLRVDWLEKKEAISSISPWLEKKKAPLCWMKTASGDFLQFFVLWW